MRIAAPTSSDVDAPLADFPAVRDRLALLRMRAANMDWTPWIIVAVGALLRLLFLGNKPPHFDEGINGWFVDQMVKNGFYKYDPTNYHGPLHFYVLFIAQTLFGRSVWALRIPVVLASIFCIHLTMRFQPIVGKTASRWAALAMAVSPAFVFYGRYTIHEIWLVMFSMLFILGLLGLWKFGTPKYLWCVGMGVFGMILTKETYIIHVGCAVIAVLVAWVTHKLVPAENTTAARQTWTYGDLAVVIAVGLAAIVFFYSGTFFNWAGLKGLYSTFAAWFHTGQAGKSGHEKVWHYWLMLITRYEIAVLIGLITSALCLAFRDIAMRYLAIYGVGTLMAYSIVAYKTPWCIISIVWPLLFIAGMLPRLAPLRLPNFAYIGVGAAAVVAAISCWVFRKNEAGFEYAWPFLFIAAILLVVGVVRSRNAATTLLAGATALALILAVRLSFFRQTTDTEPYVYVQTYNDIYKLTEPLLELARKDPTKYQLVGHMIRESSYPLPWILGDFTRVGYYERGNLPQKLDADFLVVQEDKIATVEAKLQGAYYTMPFTIRPYQDTSKLYLSASVFKDHFRGRVPDFVGRAKR